MITTTSRALDVANVIELSGKLYIPSLPHQVWYKGGKSSFIDSIANDINLTI